MRYTLRIYISFVFGFLMMVAFPSSSSSELEQPAAINLSEVILRETGRYTPRGDYSFYDEVSGDLGEAQMSAIGNRSIYAAKSTCAVDNRRVRGVLVRDLTMTIIAIESYNRSQAARSIEFFIGRLVHVVIGYLPDFSYGVAQIRPSTAMQFTDQRGSELLELLEDECESEYLASQYVEKLLSDASDLTLVEAITFVARHYNGRSKTRTGDMYTNVVLTAYSMLSAEPILLLGTMYRHEETFFGLFLSELNHQTKQLRFPDLTKIRAYASSISKRRSLFIVVHSDHRIDGGGVCTVGRQIADIWRDDDSRRIFIASKTVDEERYLSRPQSHYLLAELHFGPLYAEFDYVWEYGSTLPDDLRTVKSVCTST